MARPPTSRVVRQFAVITLLAIATVIWRSPSPTGLVIGTEAAAVVWCLAGLWRPPLLAPLYVVTETLTRPIGWLVSNLALGLTFYLVLTPIALVMRLLRRDPLGLRGRRASTYWQPMPPVERPEGYFRQS